MVVAVEVVFVSPVSAHLLEHLLQLRFAFSEPLKEKAHNTIPFLWFEEPA